MELYPKILTLFKRDPANKYKTLIHGDWAHPAFEYLAGNHWIFTEKIDGTNIRVDWDGANVTLGGRTDRAQIPAFLVNELQTLLSREKFAALYPGTMMTLYGEGYGAKIQKAGKEYIPDGVSFILFDVMIGGVWLERHNVEDIAGKLGLSVVPVIGSGTLLDALAIVCGGYTSRTAQNPQHVAEGLVMRPEVELQDRRGKRIIAKLKVRDFPREEAQRNE